MWLFDVFTLFFPPLYDSITHRKVSPFIQFSHSAPLWINFLIDNFSLLTLFHMFTNIFTLVIHRDWINIFLMILNPHELFLWRREMNVFSLRMVTIEWEFSAIFLESYTKFSLFGWKLNGKLDAGKVREIHSNSWHIQQFIISNNSYEKSSLCKFSHFLRGFSLLYCGSPPLHLTTSMRIRNLSRYMCVERERRRHKREREWCKRWI